MTALASMGFKWVVLGCFGLTVASAVFPWLNAELIVLSLPAFATSRSALVLLVLVATAGQMTGKCVVYWTGRKGDRIVSGRAGQTLSKWRERLEKRPARALALVLVSSMTGLPPFYIMTLVAGTMKMSFPRYLVAGATGRLVRFGALVSLPQLALYLHQAAA
jgi:membrane protein YqaA with SNARE-associated domain